MSTEDWVVPLLEVLLVVSFLLFYSCRRKALSYGQREVREGRATRDQMVYEDGFRNGVMQGEVADLSLKILPLPLFSLIHAAAAFFTTYETLKTRLPIWFRWFEGREPILHMVAASGGEIVCCLFHQPLH